ncbi:hypothetical protein BHE74_00047995 [Ensete ventricosum]|nr:hypothetical protein BHE74_00047995 [Ensete ventricosum]
MFTKHVTYAPCLLTWFSVADTSTVSPSSRPSFQRRGYSHPAVVSSPTPPPCGIWNMPYWIPSLSWLISACRLDLKLLLVGKLRMMASTPARHLPYPNCSRRRLLHLLACVVPPVASAALVSLPRLGKSYMNPIFYHASARSSYYDSTIAKFENPIRSNYHQTIMPPQDQALVKDANLEQMPMNLKEGGRYVVNHGEGLAAVNFSGHVSLVEKEGAGMAERRSDMGHAQQKEWSISYRWTVEWRTDRVGVNYRGRRRRCCRETTADRRISGVVAGEEEGAAVKQPTRRGCDNSRRVLLGREGTIGQRSDLVTIKQRGGARRWQRCNGGWPQEKCGRADLARKIDDREEAGNNAVGRGRGPGLPRLQGQMRAAAREKEEAAFSGGWQRRLATEADRYDRRQCKGHLRFRRGGEEDDGRRLGKEEAMERRSTSTARERGERPPMERKETNLLTMCTRSAGQLLRKE